MSNKTYESSLILIAITKTKKIPNSERLKWRIGTTMNQRSCVCPSDIFGGNIKVDPKEIEFSQIKDSILVKLVAENRAVCLPWDQALRGIITIGRKTRGRTQSRRQCACC